VGWQAPPLLDGAVEVRALAGGAPARHLPEPGAGKTRYMMLVCTDPAVDRREFDIMEPVDAWVAEMDARGVRLFGSELESPDTARTVRGRAEHAIVTDGPFAETKEQIAGFDLEMIRMQRLVSVPGDTARATLARAQLEKSWVSQTVPELSR